jgi:hypothetical protein
VRCADKEFTCPGYDNPLDRFFQDETAAVEVRAKKSKAKAIIARDERDKDARAKTAVAKMDNLFGVPLLCPLFDQGIAFFMSTYTLGLDQPSVQSKTYNQHLSTFGFHPIIATSMTALGLAGIANLCMDDGLKREAIQWYSKALKMTNRALASPAEVKSDNTLLATMLLSLFESTNNETSLIGWVNHVSGSASLLRMRGKNQFSTPAGRRMYMQVIGLLTIKCMGAGERVPDFVHQMDEEVAKWEDQNDPGNRFYHLHIAAADFRAQVLKGDITSLHAIVERAIEIDEAAKAIFEHAADDWHYETEQCVPDTPGVFGTYYHVYPHLAAAQTWNWVHYNRIFVLDIIRNSLIAGLSARPPIFVGTKYIRLLEESTKELYRMQADIIASIPQYMHDTPRVSVPYKGQLRCTYAPTSTLEGMVQTSMNATSETTTGHSRHLTAASSFTTRPSPDPASSSKLFTSNFLPFPRDRTGPVHTGPPVTPRDQLPIVRVSGGYSSLFALYIAGTTPIATRESQEYVLKTLDRVTVEFGINQAKVLASALKVKIGLDTVETEMGCGVEMRSREGKWDSVVPIYLPQTGKHLED